MIHFTCLRFFLRPSRQYTNAECARNEHKVENATTYLKVLSLNKCFNHFINLQLKVSLRSHAEADDDD